MIADIDTEAAEGAGQILLLVHWMGGVHTEMRLPRGRRGQRNSTSTEAIEAIRQLVLVATDDVIAAVLNRNGLRNGKGSRWTRELVCSLRSYRKIPAFRPTPDGVCGDQSETGRFVLVHCIAMDRLDMLDHQPNAVPEDKCLACGRQPARDVDHDSVAVSYLGALGECTPPVGESMGAAVGRDVNGNRKLHTLR